MVKEESELLLADLDAQARSLPCACLYALAGYNGMAFTPWADPAREKTPDVHRTFTHGHTPPTMRQYIGLGGSGTHGQAGRQTERRPMSPCLMPLQHSYQLIGHGTRQTDGRTDRQTDGRTVRQTNRRSDRQTDGRTDRQADRRTDGRSDRQTDRLSDRQTDGESDGQSDRQTFH
ncbi:hypothetical protein AVEN_78070-1 [Araneus ventricosus]|uniref:Uncharacterized protein n=1 Tax=Araneus ventricosus TaxID=182803 RepID=A0A4Y2F7D3_ARAVE|nr:hypothetical protein AVEN_78070-1 [Araneus ventricosus]